MSFDLFTSSLLQASRFVCNFGCVVCFLLCYFLFVSYIQL